jgi:hypothetical protein
MKYRRVEQFNKKNQNYFSKMKQEQLEKMAVNGIHPFRPF